MLTDDQLIEAFGVDDVTPRFLRGLRRVESAARADERARCVVELRSAARDWREVDDNGEPLHGDFGISVAQTLEIAACNLEGSDHDEWEEKRKREAEHMADVRAANAADAAREEERRQSDKAWSTEEDGAP